MISDRKYGSDVNEDWAINSLNDKLKLATAMERTRPLPTIAPLRVHSDDAWIWKWSDLFILQICVCFYFAFMIASYHKAFDKNKIVNDDQAYDYKQMVDNEEDACVDVYIICTSLC